LTGKRDSTSKGDRAEVLSGLERKCFSHLKHANLWKRGSDWPVVLLGCWLQIALVLGKNGGGEELKAFCCYLNQQNKTLRC